MAAEIDRSFYQDSYQKPILPDYPMKRQHDECILDAFIFKLACTFKIDTARIHNIADITGKLAEDEFGTASVVIKYAAAIEYMNYLVRPALGYEIDSLKTLSCFYDRMSSPSDSKDDIISRSFFDLLAYVEARESLNKGNIKRMLKKAMGGVMGGNMAVSKDIIPEKSRSYSANPFSISPN